MHARLLLTAVCGRRVLSGSVQFRPAIDFKYIRDNEEMLVKNAEERAAVGDVRRVSALYGQWLELQMQVTQLREARNRLAKDKTMNVDQRREEGRRIKDTLGEVEERMRSTEEAMFSEGASLPNLSHPDAPVGPEENAVVVDTIGTKPVFDGWEPLDHVTIGEKHDMFDFHRASEAAGSKFVYLKNHAAALMELDLVRWAMQQAMDSGFTGMLTPDVVRHQVVESCGFQSRGDHSQIYGLDFTGLSLVGTAELPLAAYHMNTMMSEKDLETPIRYVAHSHCFRREAGAGGKQSGGLYRLHQFSKVELFVVCKPEHSEEQMKELVGFQKRLVEGLGLHARVLSMPTMELGASAYQKFDIEAWMPGRNGYGEISSASNCTDYQSRRLNIRFKRANGEKAFVHTLNATAIAVPRIMLALLETHQQPDGSVRLPAPLQHLNSTLGCA